MTTKKIRKAEAFLERMELYPIDEDSEERASSELDYIIEEAWDEINIINLTPHEVVVFTEKEDWESGEVVSGKEIIPISGIVARIETKIEKEATGRGIKFGRIFAGEVIPDLPPKKDGTIYIVSTMVREASKHRDDLYSPANFGRDESGRITGCRALVR